MAKESSPFEIWRRRRQREGPTVTLIDLYRMVAEPRGLAAQELPLDERHILEIGARVAGGLQTQPSEFGRDVRRRLEIVFAAGEATHHRIVGVEIEAGHEIGWRDGGLRARGGMLER